MKIDTWKIERFTDTKCIGYSQNFTYTHYQQVAILKDGRTVTLYIKTKGNEYSDYYTTDRPIVDTPVP